MLLTRSWHAFAPFRLAECHLLAGTVMFGSARGSCLRLLMSSNLEAVLTFTTLDPINSAGTKPTNQAQQHRSPAASKQAQQPCQRQKSVIESHKDYTAKAAVHVANQNWGAKHAVFLRTDQGICRPFV